MSKNNKRKYLENAAKSPQQKTHFIDQNVARQLPIIFGFKNLILDKKPFDCLPKHAGGILYVLNIFRIISQVLRHSLEISYPKCHLVPDDQVKKHNLNYLVEKAPNKKLHQLGRNDTPERVIGYFDSPNSNLFQVCLLDLNHRLSGD